MSKRTRASDPRPGIVSSACAREGGGKTEYGLTMPGHQMWCSVDPNTRAVIEKAVAERRITDDRITLHALHMPHVAFNDNDDVKDDAQSKWDALIDALRPVVKQEADPMPNSVIFDTATEIDVLNVLGEFGKTDQISPESRRNRMGPVNRRYMGMIRALSDVGCHVLLLHRTFDVYKTVDASEDGPVRGRRGGQERREKVEGVFAFERKGFKETGNITSLEVLLAHDETRSEKIAGQFGIKISRCTLRPGLKGREWWGREKLADGTRVKRASFPFIATQVYAGTRLEDWQ